jgi:hypothetical protein
MAHEMMPLMEPSMQPLIRPVMKRRLSVNGMAGMGSR